MYLSIQIPVQKNECLQAANCDSKLRLDGEGMLEESLGFGPIGQQEGLDIDVGQRWGALAHSRFGTGFPIGPTCMVVELQEGSEGEYKIN